MNKLFRVTKRIDPEWGASRVEFTKYFEAPQKSDVEYYVRQTYGKAGWYSYDREEIVYEIEEVEPIKIAGRCDDDYW